MVRGKMEKDFDIMQQPSNRTTFRATHISQRFPVGFLSVHIQSVNAYCEYGSLEAIFTDVMRHPDFKGKGICKALAEKGIEYALSEPNDCDRLYIAIYYKREGLIKLFRSLGFKEIEKMTDEYLRFERWNNDIMEKE